MNGSFKILQFNMQFGQGWDAADPDHAPIHLDDVIAEIKAHDADIVMLQEVEQAQEGGVQPAVPPNYARLKTALPGYDSYFSYPKADLQELPFGIGEAIFSKTPLRDMMRLDLPSPPIEFDFRGTKKTATDRLLIGATTTIHGRELRLLNVHLLAFFMLGSSSLQHPGQRRLVAEQLRQSTGPTLLTGDFNVAQHYSLTKQFSEVGFRPVQTREVTWRRRPYVLDHIFYSRHLRPGQHWVKPTLASDHHALVAEFTFED